MPASSPLPPELVTDIVLRTLQLDSPIGDVSSVRRAWHAIVSQNLGQILLHRLHGDMPGALSRALQHGKLDVATWQVSRAASLEESNRALLLVASQGQADLARLLLTAPQHPAHADCHDGQALLSAATSDHSAIVCMLLDAPQHAAHADCRDGEALMWASAHEITRMLLDAPQHAAHADC
jgi:hypothetical protein